jgi:starch phosphorylase
MLLLARNIPLELESLVKQILTLATDLRWTWSHDGDTFWQYLDTKTWTLTRNPYAVLQKLSVKRLTELHNDEDFPKHLNTLLGAREDYLTKDCWAEQHFTKSKQAQIAYFSMEFGLSEALPLYAGGLGILAGDYLKTASDLGVPAIGIGLLYDEGYFRQYLDSDGWQHEMYPHNDSRNLPLQPVITVDGAWLTIEITLPGRTLYLQVWQAQVGRTTLYLLDSNDPLNNPVDQAITGRLYAGSEELRLIQEIVLGVGGWQVIEALKLDIQLCHLNEGHAAFAALERARCFMHKNNLNFWQALWATRAGNIFTTHTPVAAAFDTFPADLLEHYGQHYADTLGINPEHLLNMGKMIADDDNGRFNMAYLAARTCARINGVSELHGVVSKNIFSGLYPDWPLAEIPVSHVTNGVHMPSWDSALADKVWTDSCGKDRWLGAQECLDNKIKKLDDNEIWSLRGQQRTDLIHYVRRRLSDQKRRSPNSGQPIEQAQTILDPNILTLGFARRFTEYKRPNLLLADQQRLLNLLSNTQMPLQIIIAGKAHPKDNTGKHFIKEWFSFLQRPDVRPHIVFLEDYDIRLAQHMVQGVDLWLNTPRRPWEACGTSGMKVLVNGGLNISELDGWWAEAYTANVGWALGDGEQHNESDWDKIEAQQLYTLLEDQIIPAFYHRDEEGIPIEWIQMIRNSMSSLTPKFSSNRMLREYTEKLYLPALADYKMRNQNGVELAHKLEQWQTQLAHYGDNILWGDLRVELHTDSRSFVVSVYFGDVPVDYIQIQLFADAKNPGHSLFCQKMNCEAAIPGSLNGFIYRIELQSNRQVEDYTPRVIAVHKSVQVPCENHFIKWWSGSRTIVSEAEL